MMIEWWFFFDGVCVMKFDFFKWLSSFVVFEREVFIFFVILFIFSVLWLFRSISIFICGMFILSFIYFDILLSFVDVIIFIYKI